MLSTVPAQIPEWLSSASSGSARPNEGSLFDFGDPLGEARAALEDSAIFPLSQLGSLQAQGADVEAFLQGQLSNDIGQLTLERAQLSSYNSPKGRVIAVLTLTRNADGVRLETRSELTAALIKRLRMYVLRAKVQWDDLTASHPQFGICGARAAELLTQLGIQVPRSEEWAVANDRQITVVRRSGTIPRYSVQAPVETIRELWAALASRALPAGPAAWRLLDILAGVPSVSVPTQEHFVAQMLNLDTLGGISFTKGCYPGQEVVARMHYLGNLKRRMVLGFSASPASAGTEIYLAEGETQAVGEVVESAVHPQRGAALLLVLQDRCKDADGLRLQSPQGEPLQIETTTLRA